MEFESLNFLLYAALVGASLAGAIIATRRVSAGIFDYWIAIPVQQALVLAYASYAFSDDQLTVLQFLYIAGGLAAFALGSRVLDDAPRPVRGGAEPRPEYSALYRSVLYCLCGYQAIADAVYVVAKGGIPAFMPDGIHPNMYVGGFGIVKYIHDANAAAIPALAFTLAIFWRDWRALAVGCFFALYPQMLMEWSKTAVLGLPLLFVTVNRYCGDRFGRRIVVPRRLAVVAASLLLAFVAYKFSEAVDQGYESSVALAILKRVVNTADSVFMYFQLDGHVYFKGDVTLPAWLLSHVAPYAGFGNTVAQEFGVLLAQYTLGIGEGGFGPYPPFQVVGHLTMGTVGGLAYCFVIGLVLAAIRRTTVPLPWLPVHLVVFNAALYLAGDSSLFAYSLFCHVFTIPAYMAGVALRGAFRDTGPRKNPEIETLGTVRT